jgi:type I restriction enzyme, S subunit
MNSERLLRHYEQTADAPDAVGRLRRFVLDLAVRGKLVPQDAGEEPASELLKRIGKEKARLVQAGEIRREKALEPISDKELPFHLPSGWEWSRLGALIHLVSGQHLQPPEYSENPKDGLPYITGPSDFGIDGLQITRFALVRKAVAKQGQLLLTVKGSGVGKTTTCNIPEVAISRQLMALTAIAWERRFLVLVTHRLAETLQDSARSLIPGISREDVEEFVLALPPLAEQRRIVAKVDELTELCDRLEAARGNRRSNRRQC